MLARKIFTSFILERKKYFIPACTPNHLTLFSFIPKKEVTMTFVFNESRDLVVWNSGPLLFLVILWRHNLNPKFYPVSSNVIPESLNCDISEFIKWSRDREMDHSMNHKYKVFLMNIFIFYAFWLSLSNYFLTLARAWTRRRDLFYINFIFYINKKIKNLTCLTSVYSLIAYSPLFCEKEKRKKLLNDKKFHHYDFIFHFHFLSKFVTNKASSERQRYPELRSTIVYLFLKNSGIKLRRRISH